MLEHTALTVSHETLQPQVLNDFRAIAIDQLQESPTNPRRTFDEAKLQELAQSVRAKGIIVPLVVRAINLDRFEIVAGARRYRAARIAELETVPVRVVDLDDAEVLEYQLIENAIREDVHPYEEAMAYQKLLEKPGYDVAAIADKTGRSQTHIYQRLRLAALIPEAAEAFQANRIHSGHANLIARLPENQQAQALEAAFQRNWRTEETNAGPVRELAQWIRDNLMLTLSDAVFDRENVDLLPSAGACTTCSKHTGANTALFDDFREDDRCLDADCFKGKVDAHIAFEKERRAGLVQITRAYHTTNSNGAEPILTRHDYTIIEPPPVNAESQDQKGKPRPTDEPPCSRATKAIVVEGPGRRGEIVEVCADPSCEVHGQPHWKVEQEAAAKQRHDQLERAWRERQKHKENNVRILDSVLAKLPKVLTVEDYRMVVNVTLERFEGAYGLFDVICERYKIDTDEMSEPDAAMFELRKRTEKASTQDLIRMLVELTLIPSGYSDEELDHLDPLISAAIRYGVPLKPEKPQKQKPAPKSAPNAAGKTAKGGKTAKDKRKKQAAPASVAKGKRA